MTPPPPPDVECRLGRDPTPFEALFFKPLDPEQCLCPIHNPEGISYYRNGFI